MRELPDAGPDEIWVIQIDPEKREEEPTSIADILNELAGNVSLYQEVHSIDKINQFVEALGRAKTRAKSGSASPGSGITGRSRCAGSS